MKLNQNQNSIQGKIFKPNPPTDEMIRKAKFIDKTYVWNKK